MKIGSPQYQRMLDIIGGALAVGGVGVVTLQEFNHSHNDILDYQRWAFAKIDSFFGVTRDDLVQAGWTPKKVVPVESGKKRSSS
jgi:hypothetical protein